MNVLHISSAKTIRGGEKQICNLIKHLSKLGVKNFLCCPSGSELSSVHISGLYKQSTYLKLSPANIFVSAFIKRIVQEEQIDLIHVHDAHGHQFCYFAYKLFKLNIPGILTRRVSYPVKVSSISFYNLTRFYKIICVSSSVRSALEASGIDKSKLMVIPSGIESTQKFETGIREKYGIQSDEILIGNMAAISDDKDFESFVKTADLLLKETNFKLKFLIVGNDAGALDKTVRLIDQLGLTKKIIITGHITESSRYLHELDLILSTSKIEGLGNTIMEAFKAKVPVVATACQGTIDLITNEENGLLADVGDVEGLALNVKRVLKDDVLRIAITSVAYNSLARYDMDAVSQEILNVYREAINQ